MDASLAIRVGDTGTVTHQTAGGGELARKIDRRHCVACCQRHELFALVGEERIGGDKERANPTLGNGRKRGIDLAFVAGVDHAELESKRTRRSAYVDRILKGAKPGGTIYAP